MRTLPGVRRRLGLFAGACAVVGFIALPIAELPHPTSTVILDANGALLGAAIAPDGQWRFPSTRAVPERYVTALVLFEDRRVWFHPGIDPVSVVRAVVDNLTAGRVVSGASTVTMQVVRLSRRHHFGHERTIREKLIEGLLALRLEAARSKEEILRMYAAHAPFGGNVVGLEAASFRYFGASPDALTWAEAATLAVLPNNPSLVHPGRNRDRLRQKRDRLLQRLHAAGHLSHLDLQRALAEDLPTAPHPLPQLAPHLLARARHQGRGGGGFVRTTLDRGLQERALEVVTRHHHALAASGIHNAAALILDVESGHALAYVGNVPPQGAHAESLSAEGEEHGQYVDVVTAPRSTGSLLKPFLYAEMLDAGELLPTSLVPDIPTRIGGFAPENFSRTYDGAVPANEALSRSLNVPMVHLLRAFGVERFHRLLGRLGMSTLSRPPAQYGLTLILGGAEGTLWDLTGMFRGLARAALERPDPFAAPQTFIGDNQLEAGPPPTGASPIGAGAAFLTLEAMLEVERPGVDQAWRRFAGGRKVAWKTGTSFGFRDGWALGVTPRHAVGVWVGNADGEGRPGLTGARAAAPILFALFDLLPESDWFVAPTEHLSPVIICRHSGMRAGPNCEEHAYQMVPHHALRTEPCRYCTRVHWDATGRWRVHAACEAPNAIHPKSHFVLPPQLEWAYRARHPSYRPLPELRPDCRPPSQDDVQALAMITPKPNAQVFIPRGLDGTRGQAIFEATHRDLDAELFWHIDGVYLGSTRHIHQMPVTPAPGAHQLTVVDHRGALIEQHFVVLPR